MCNKAYSARVNISHVATNDKFGRAYLPPVVINSRADRNLLKWQQSLIPSSSSFRFVISQKVTTTRATRLSSLTVLATHRTDGSRHDVMPGVIVFPTAVAEAAMFIPLSTNRFSSNDCHALGRILKRAYSPLGQTRRKVDPRFNVMLKERFLKHFRRISYVLERAQLAR